MLGPVELVDDAGDMVELSGAKMRGLLAVLAVEAGRTVTPQRLIDVLWGGLLSAGGLSAAVYAMIEGPHRGWSDGLVVGGFLVGAAALVGFVLWELSREEPLLDPRATEGVEP